MAVNIDTLFHQKIIVDTSVLMKVILVEDGSETAKKIFSLHRDMQLTLLATPLIFFEFLNVVSNRLKNKNQTIKIFKKFYDFKIGIIDAKYGYLEKGIRAACENSQVSYYDSSYHALAKEMCGIFLTADEKYYNAMKHEGSIVLLSNISI